jgi:hypothetical protein
MTIETDIKDLRERVGELESKVAYLSELKRLDDYVKTHIDPEQ